MGAAREADQADFDLDRFIDMFDEAMTSKDPRVIETLRSLMMIVTLTRPEATTKHDRLTGPLRRLYDDMYNLNRRMSQMDEDLRNMSNQMHRSSQPYRWEAEDKYTMAAAQKLAVDMDRDIINKLTSQINSGVWPKGTLK
jgi:hypothetical protein